MPIVRNFFKGNYYHVYSRGVEKRIIFLSEEDYKRFMRSIFLFNSTKTIRIDRKIEIIEKDKLVQILSFKLMPNHIHMKLKEIKKGGISKYMQKLITSYTMYFNKKYNRFGSLFGTRFKDKIIETDEYFSYLDFYIRHNCIKIIRPQYDIYKIFCGEIKLTDEEQKFVNDYPYYWQGST